MRTSDAPLRPGDVVAVRFGDRVIEARRGETVAAALSAEGVLSFRDTRTGAERGLFCGMGVCQDCLVEIDGVPNQPACMTKLDHDVTVRRQDWPPQLPVAPPESISPAGHPDPEPDMLVIGGGVGGLRAAAAAAESGLRVVLIDERPAPGGQYFKQPAAGLDLPAGLLADPQFAGGRALIDRAVGAGVNVVRGTVVTAAPPRTVSAVLPGIGLVRFSPRRLVVATGAYERPLPVPGWTQAGVMTTGALQTLLRSYRVVPRQRIVIAGNGPLNLQVALELSRAGAEVVGVAELAPRPGPGRAGDLMRMALASPGLAWQGAATLAALARGRVPVHWDSVLASIERKGDGLVATLSRPGRAAGSPLRLEADIVATGYGFLPSDEILRLLGVEQDFDPVRGQRITRRDEAMATSVEGVHAVGDCCGLGGAPAAQAEGLVAGLAVARALDGSPGPSLLREEGEALSALGRHRAFQAALWSLFAAPRPGLSLATPETIVCRCEEVTLADLQAARDAGAGDIGALKRATRCGMGPCQGRYCADAAAFLLAGDPAGLDAGSFFAPRPPIRPVPLGQFVVEGSHAVPHPLQDAEG